MNKDELNFITKEVDRGIIGNIEFAINYLTELVPVKFIIKNAVRYEYPDYPEDAYREAIVNAIVHRDYFESVDVAVEKLKNSIIINNPGGLLFEKEKFGTFSFHRNRLIADILSKTKYMEKAGTGINRIKDFCVENNNKIKFNFDNFCFFTTINKKYKDGSKISENQQKIIDLITENKYISANELSKKIGILKRNIENHISKLKKKGIIERSGKTSSGYWIIKNKDKNNE